MAKGHTFDSIGYRQTANNSGLNQNSTHYGATGGIHQTPPDASTGKTIQPEKDRTTLTQCHSADDSCQTNCQRHYNDPKSQGKVLPSRGDLNRSLKLSSAAPPQPGKTTGTDEIVKVFSYGTDGDDITTDMPDYVHIEKYAGTDIQLSGAVNREETIFTEETHTPGTVRSDQVVSAQEVKVTLPFALSPELGTERCDGTCPMVCRKGSPKEQHQKRLIPKDTCLRCEGGFHPTVNHNLGDHLRRRENLFGMCQHKVGLICCRQCGDRGTCFRIGRHNIVTCNHVICTCEDHDVIAVFFHQGPEQQIISYRMTKIHIDEERDFAILKLCDNGTGYFPPAFTNFRKSAATDGSQEYPVYVVCFQKDLATEESSLVVSCDTVRLKNNIFDKPLHESNIELMKKFPHIKGLPYGQGHVHKEGGSIPLISDVTHGGSGGVGICVDHSGHPVVEFMYRRGYPGIYYNTNGETALSKEQKDQLSICWRMEIGLDIIKIMEHSQPEHWECDEHVSTSAWNELINQ